MKILVLNCGSSSIKYALYNMDDQSVLTSGGIEKIGLPDSFIKIKLADGRKVQIDEPIPEHTKGVKFIRFSLKANMQCSTALTSSTLLATALYTAERSSTRAYSSPTK